MESAELVKLTLKSPAFEAGESIPERYTCDGENINPALELGNLPPETQSLTLIMDDPDAPSGTWLHWLAWDLPPVTTIEENATAGRSGLNDFGVSQYKGPCPPIGQHRYFFRVFALDKLLNLPSGSTKAELLKAMQNHILGSGELMGTYS